MRKKISQVAPSGRDASYIFVTAAKEAWGAERSMSIILRDRASGLAGKSHVVCVSEETASFLAAEAGVSVEVSEHAAGRISALLAVYKKLRKLPPGTCIVVFSLQFLPLLPLLRVLPGARYRLVADIHDAPRGWIDRLASAACVRFAHEIISISEYVSKHLWMSSSAVVIPRPIEEPRSDFDRTLPIGEEITVGIVGRVDREKCIDVAVRAVGSLVDRFDMRLNIYGAAHLDSDYPAELRELAGRFGKDFVHFAGVREPSEIYSEIDVLVVANANEPSGRTVGEAMMHGVVVAAPNSGGAQEFFENGVSGVTYEARDEAALASVLLTLAGSADFRLRLASCAKEQILSERSPHVAVGAYAKLLENVVSK